MRVVSKVVRVSLSAVLLVVGAMTATSLADEKSAADGDDPGGLDIRAVSQSHLRDGVVRHTIDFDQAWDRSMLDPASNPSGKILLSFRVRKTSTTKVARSIPLGLNEDGTFHAPIYSDNGIAGYANVWKPDGDSIHIEFPAKVLRVRGRELRWYKWQAGTNFFADPGTGTDCDEQPGSDNQGCPDSTAWLSHRLGG